MLAIYLMMIMQLFRYQYAEEPKTATETIQFLSRKAECELEINCLEGRDGGSCCYDCTGCTDPMCSSHWQCCSADDFKFYGSDGDGSNGNYGGGNYGGGGYGGGNYGGGGYGGGDYGGGGYGGGGYGGGGYGGGGYGGGGYGGGGYGGGGYGGGGYGGGGDGGGGYGGGDGGGGDDGGGGYGGGGYGGYGGGGDGGYGDGGDGGYGGGGYGDGGDGGGSYGGGGDGGGGYGDGGYGGGGDDGGGYGDGGGGGGGYGGGGYGGGGYGGGGYGGGGGGGGGYGDGGYGGGGDGGGGGGGYGGGGYGSGGYGGGGYGSGGYGGGGYGGGGYGGYGGGGYGGGGYGGGGYGDGGDGDYDADYDSFEVKCTKLFIMRNTQKNGMEPASLSFKMISTCPKYVPKQLKKLCTDNEEEQVIDLIPVLVDTYYLYRNIHCLRCNNEGSKLGTRLNLALSRRPRHYYDPFMSLKIETKSNFSDFDITSIQTTDTLILSVTPHFIDTNITLQMCRQAVDMWDCKNNPNISKSYSDACKRFEWDSFSSGIGIRVKDTTTNQTYIAKNIACAYCALGDKMAVAADDNNGMKRCRLEYPAEPWLLLNPLLLTDDDDATDDGILYVLQTGPNGDLDSCELGHFFDKVSTTCRKILCPRHHFMYRGKCHPTFTHSVGQAYYVKVKVLIQQDDDDFYNKFGLAVVDAILQKSNFLPCDVRSTLKYDSNNNTMAAILEIFFSAHRGTLYKDALDMIMPLFQDDPFTFTFNGLEYRIYPADDVVYSKDEPGRLMKHDHDELSELRSKPNSEWRFNGTRHCQQPISLTGMDVCLRVYLKVDDARGLLKKLSDDYKEQIDNDTVAVCLRKYDKDFNYRYVEYKGNSGQGDNSGDDGDNSADGENPNDLNSNGLSVHISAKGCPKYFCILIVFYLIFVLY